MLVGVEPCLLIRAPPRDGACGALDDDDNDVDKRSITCRFAALRGKPRRRWILRHAVRRLTRRLGQILLSVLSLLPTPDLVPLTAVSRPFHHVAVRLLQLRMARAAALPQHQLILECYHPSAKISTPYLHCDYLGTDGLDGAGNGRGDRYLSLEELAGLYSRFRPVPQEENRRPRQRYPRRSAGGASPGVGAGSPMELGGRRELGRSDPSASGEGAGLQFDPGPASHEINLDETELFSQLCTVTNVVKCGPKRGLFLSHVNVGDGVIRVWRDWLAARAAAIAFSGTGLRGDPGESVRERPGPSSCQDDKDILWVDADKVVGVRFHVVENTNLQRPILVRPDENLPVSYTLEYEGKPRASLEVFAHHPLALTDVVTELLVRTSKLLLMVEKSDMQEISPTGKAVVIASI